MGQETLYTLRLKHTYKRIKLDIVSFTSDGYRQGLALPRDKGASTQLDPIQAVVVALVGALGAWESEGDGRGEGG